MDKQQEIKILQSLKGDTYFNQFFKNEDIDKMCENIRNDFSIEYDCSFYEKATMLQATLKRVAKEQAEFNQVIAFRIVETLVGDTNLFDDILESLTSKLSIIKYKRERGYVLNNSEIDYLIEKAEK